MSKFTNLIKDALSDKILVLIVFMAVAVVTGGGIVAYKEYKDMNSKNDETTQSDPKKSTGSLLSPYTSRPSITSQSNSSGTQPTTKDNTSTNRSSSPTYGTSSPLTAQPEPWQEPTCNETLKAQALAKKEQSLAEEQERYNTRITLITTQFENSTSPGRWYTYQEGLSTQDALNKDRISDINFEYKDTLIDINCY